MSGQGNAGRKGGSKGSIWANIKVKPHEVFKRQGDHVSLDIPIPVWTAILGGTVNVPTLTGEVNLKVAAGTQPGAKVVMKGKGIKNLTSARKGHQYVVFNIEVPKKLSDRQKELVEEIANMDKPEASEKQEDK